MSSPRAATSVATSSGRRPSLNEIITPSRAPWVMSPWIALTFIPRSRSVRYSCSVRTLVRTNTIAWSGRSALSTSTSLSAFSRARTSSANCSTVSTVRVAACTLHGHRVVQVLIGEAPDLGRHRRREQRGLAARRGQRQDPLDVLEEAEVEHLIGLVEHDEAAPVQHQRMARDQVLDAPDRSHDHVAAGAQLRLLGADRRPAEHRHHVDALAPAVRAQRLSHLDAQLAGRREHEPLDVVLARVDVLEHRQPERRRLTRSGLRLPNDVVALEQGRDRLLLNRARRLVSDVVDGLEDVGVESKIGKTRHYH